ncbi:MAG: hypothetical protein ACE5EX_05465 [Phycisphaerae bacterium]
MSGALQTLALRPQVNRASAFRKPAGPDAGPPLPISGSAASLTRGLYDSLGRLLGVDQAPFRQGVAGQRAESVSPADKKRVATLQAAAARIEAGDIRGGRELAEGLVDRNHTDVAAIRLVARAFLSERDYRQAERQLARAATLAPNDGRIARERDIAALLQRNDGEVVAVARRMVKDPQRRGEGLRLLLHLTDRSPDNADAFLALADGFRDARMPQQVVGALQEALRVAGDTRINAVIQRANELVREYPRAGIAHNILGRALAKADRVDQAVRELKTATDVAPFSFAYRRDLAEAHVLRARTRLDAGGAEAAALELDLARALDPSNPGLDDVIARLEADRARKIIVRGHPEKALPALAKAAASAGADPSFRRILANLHLSVAEYFQNEGSDTQALSLFQKALELHPDSTVARRRVADVSHLEGLAALDAKDYDRAVEHLRLAYNTQRLSTDFGTDLARAYDLRGQQRLALGKTGEAIEDFKAGLAIDPTNASLTTNFSKAVGT